MNEWLQNLNYNGTIVRSFEAYEDDVDDVDYEATCCNIKWYNNRV